MTAIALPSPPPPPPSPPLPPPSLPFFLSCLILCFRSSLLSGFHYPLIVFCICFFSYFLFPIFLFHHLCSWIGNRFSDHQQLVVLNREISHWQNITSGVPQGSVLGSTLFFIYVNNLEINLLSKEATFVDDTKLGGKVKCF